ncbi:MULTISPECIES: GNAT family N-acetyltransferase [unclassified Streptomyces]|uniref:GNAT family N-acetyltransferase n=1 Tax=unclassified Streptomyces TaxID=2593676 RepID=UPI0007ED3AB4|nr:MULTISPECIES: GNAT family N-acetyltransferase [unclassified Streptomyces]MCP3766966.1 GNAT family N-acetyltransferase [Streptomyces sp. MAR25Y5]OBQ50975.1 acetyltransferase [Streptomyces sp. H-KF8]
MDLVIRPVRSGEYEKPGEITARACPEDGLLGFGEDDPYLGELGNVAERAVTAEVPAAVDGGRVVGGVTFVPDGGPMADLAGPGEAGLRMLVVARAARGRGAGLVRTCVDRARATRGCGGIALSTQRMTHSAHRIHERLGFARAPGRDRNPVPHLDDIDLLAYTLTF